MNSKIRNLVVASLLFSGSLAYYYALSSKIWTWIYTSGDSGDWMQFVNWWITPQPFGSPFFISTIRLLGILFPNADTYQLLTFCLTVLPGAILVVLTYFIGLELTKNWKIAATSSLVLMGMSITLSQATVFEQYIVASVFVTGAYLAYLKNNWAVAFALLGLGVANHIIVGTIGFIWFVVEWQQKKRLFKLLPIFIILGIVPYALTLYLMATDTPKLFAGGLSWQSLNVYLGILGHFGDLSASVLPQRLFDMFTVTLGTLGLAIYPLIIGVWGQRTKYDQIALGSVLWTVWFWVSNTFFSTFKYVVIVTPLVAGLVARGLSKLPKWHTAVVALGAVALIITNSVFLNADKLARVDPQATNLYEALISLPDGSAVVTPRGGAFGFSLFYALSEGKDLIPLLITKNTPAGLVKSDLEIDRGYLDYLEWFKRNYDLEGNDSFALSREALDKGLEVYFLSPTNDTVWDRAYQLEPTGVYGLSRITDIYVNDWEEWIEELYGE